MDPTALPWQFLKARTRVIVRDANGGGPLFIIEGGHNERAVKALEGSMRVLALADELTAAIDLAEEDIGGARPVKEILGELGPAVEVALGRA